MSILEVTILFVHHDSCQVTQTHYEVLNNSHPGNVIPVFCNDGTCGNPLPNAIRLPMSYTRGRNWHNVDWIVRDWFRSCDRIDSKRYVIIDWDCYCNISLQAWFGEWWDSHLVGSNVADASWYWFSQRDFLPHSLFRFACGVWPLNGLLISNLAMHVFASEALPDGVFSELRLPTVLAGRGFQASGLPTEKSQNNTYLSNRESVRVVGDGLFHPVKQLLSEQVP
jgi:hypothetical protein